MFFFGKYKKQRVISSEKYIHKITHIYSIASVFDKVYFGTNQGIRIFNKENKNFGVFSIKEGLIENNVQAILIDFPCIWFGTWGGVTQYNFLSKKLRNFTTKTGLSSNQILSMANDKDFIYIGTNGGGICVYDKLKNIWKIWNRNNGLGNNFVYALTSDKDFLYIATSEALLNIYNKKTKKWKIYSPGKKFKLINFCSIVCTNDYIWLGSDKNGVFRFDKKNNSWKVWTISSGFTNSVYDLKINKKNEVYAATENGLFKYIPEIESWVKIDTSNLKDKKGNSPLIESLAVDEKEIWCGTYKQGIGKFIEDELKWEIFHPGLSCNYVKTIAQDRSYLYIGFDYQYKGIDCFNKQTKEWLHIFINQPIKVVKSNDNYLFVGTWQKGLIRLDKKTNKEDIFTVEQGISCNDITSLEIDKDEIWIGTYYGLSKLNNSNLKVFQYLNKEEIVSISVSKEYVSCSTPFKIYLYNKTNNKWKTLLKLKNRITVCKLANSDLWIGIEKKGILKYNLKTKQKKWYKKSIFKKGLLSNNISEILINKNHIYFATERGVSIYNKEEKNWKNIILKELVYPEVLSLIEDEKYLFIGTRLGLIQWEK